MGAREVSISAIYRNSLIGKCTVAETNNIQVTIGREPGNNIVIPSQYVGRVHCVLRFYNGIWYAQNQSRNGSFINGCPIDGFTPVNTGDRLSLLSGDKEILIQFSHPTWGRNCTRVNDKDENDLELLVFDGKDSVFRYRLDRTQNRQYRFGRDADNDIVIDSAAISGHHGVIEMTGGVCTLCDTGSTNGIWINGTHYVGRQNYLHELHAGDVLRVDADKDRGSLGAMLVVTDGVGEWHRYRLSNNKPNVIGRAEHSDIRLRHVGVSRRHAVINYRAGGYYIENFGTNGTLVDNAIITGTVPLRNRSTISVTTTTFYLCGDELYYYLSEGGLRLEARELTRDVTNHGKTKRILNGVNLSIEPGEFVAIIGGSGCGKSTLLNALTGYERATDGTVLVGDKSLYSNYDYFKSLIGFVPQQDIVYDFLQLDKMLDYTAQLRMPKDTGREERAARVKDVLKMVELSEFSTSMIKKLSGGQRKRASIAVELLADPGLFFLDEPTSGLDPGTERNLMHTLRRLATEKRKTVIMVTHTTLNLQLCDKIVFMGKGGKLCFCGSPDDALRFFGVDNFVDIYNLVAEDTDKWHDAFDRSVNRAGRTPPEPLEIGRTERPSFFKQAGVLSKRYMNLICNDRARLLLMLVEPILMGLILYICKQDEMFEAYIATKNLLFTYVCCAIWIGIFNSVQEICKERVILKREYMANLRLSSYISSKFIVQAMLCLAQSVLLFSVFALTIGMPEEGMLLSSPAPEMLLTTYLAILASTCMGLALSSVANNPDRAMTLSPFLLVVQLVFAGIIFELEGVVELISNITISRWAISALGVSADLEGLYEGFAAKQAMLNPGGDSGADIVEKMFEHSDANMLKCWLIMLAFCIVFCVISALLLRNVSKDSR